MTDAYINRIATAVPDHDVHGKFVDYALSRLSVRRDRTLFQRMAGRAQIDHRYSFLRPHADPGRVDDDGFYRLSGFPETEERMKFYERHAFTLARRALDRLDFAAMAGEITHLIVTTCTGFYAPGIDLQVMEHYGLRPSTERTVIGFMGCQAGLNALKLARHIVRSDAGAKVAVLNLELCTLHLKEAGGLEQILSFLLFADGCAASIVSADPAGIELQSFHSTVMPGSGDQITWHIGDVGFDMVLSGQVPQTITRGLPGFMDAILPGRRADETRHWAIHPGGRTIIDAVRDGAGLPEDALATSRDVLRRFGNMSSATVMFVLQEMMRAGTQAGSGCAMAFGPGLSIESLLFQTAA